MELRIKQERRGALGKTQDTRHKTQDGCGATFFLGVKMLLGGGKNAEKG